MKDQSKLNRRLFLKRTALAGAGLTLLPRVGWAYAQSPGGIRKFVTPLTGLGPGGIPVLTPNKTRFPGSDYYEIAARQFRQTIYDYNGLTLCPRFFGFGARTASSTQYLGGVIVASQGRPVKLKAYNQLPAQHILPVDNTVMDPNMNAAVRHDRMAIHIHGGKVHWHMDGGPFHWFSNPANNGGFQFGSSFINGPTSGQDVGWALYDYPNDQSARLVWYHDHAYGLTRLNAYAGMATGYLITDDSERRMIAQGILPDPLGAPYTLGIPLVIQDKGFYDPESDNGAYGSITGAQKGDLWYPYKYESLGSDPSRDLPPSTLNPDGSYPCPGDGYTGRWDWLEGPLKPPTPSCVPEAFFDTIVVNGAPYPSITLPPGRFRFRVLNASQARFFNLQMYVKNNSPDGITLRPTADLDPNGNPVLAPTNAPGPAFIQIGNECGFLPAPVVFNQGRNNRNSNRPMGFDLNPVSPTFGNATRYNLLLAPAERADIIVDFRGFAGQRIILYNDAPAPFPSGDIRNDYYPGAPDLTCIGGAATPVPGQGPDTRTIMEFHIQGTPTCDMDFSMTIARLHGALALAYVQRGDWPLVPRKRNEVEIKTLNEDFDAYGRLRQVLGTGLVTGADTSTNPPIPMFGTDYLSVPTEVARAREVQTWRIFNLTGDVHPMHFHLVNVQVMYREAFVLNPDGSFMLIPSTRRGPDPNELGWKETLRMNPGEAITVMMRFDLPSGSPPFSPRLQSLSPPVNGYEYVWHCHILEHEEHDMMHALVVTP